MEKFNITVGNEANPQTFEVINNVNQSDSKSSFDLLRDGIVVLSIEPDEGFLRTNDNPGNLDEQTIHQIIDKIEAYQL